MTMELRDARQELSAAKTRFQMLSDEDLITASIHEMEALEARCRYLLRLARQQGVCSTPPRPKEESAYSCTKG